MRYERHYIQYNDLVFDYYDMISEDDYTDKFKYDSESYTFRHGDYVAHKYPYMLADAGSVSLTITLEMKKIPCEYRPYYMDFAKSELSKQGKLWAVENNRIIWAYAFVDEISYIHEVRKNTAQMDVSFVIPEGIWHKADLQKTFLVPYSSCDFMECMDYQTLQPCDFGNCCVCESEGEVILDDSTVIGRAIVGTSRIGQLMDDSDRIGTAIIGYSKIGGNKEIIYYNGRDDKECDCCDCGLDKDMALCYHTGEMQSLYSCHNDYKIVYDCVAAEKLFDHGEEHMGQKLCACNGIIRGQFYSDTSIPTQGVKITIHGTLHDPMIVINDNANIIRGDFENLVIYPDGSVYSGKCKDCLVSASSWDVPSNMDYGWTVYPGNNRIVIYGGSCCGAICVYIEIDSLA